MNKVTMIGCLGKDPELVNTTNGKKVCRFSIAVKRTYGERKADFFNCVAWGNLGENIAKYCKTGSRVGISGSIEVNSYTDKSGNKRNDTVIVVAETEFLQPKSSGGSNSNEQAQTAEESAPDTDYPF